MKKKFSFLLVLAVLVMGLSACGGSKSDTTSETKAPKATETAEATKKPESKTTDTKGKHHAKIKVKDYGTIEVELDGDTAPITVANFVKLVNEKFYDGLTFHRIMSGFMIQGGDPLGNGTGGSDETIKGEFSSNGVENNISHKRGVISMARSSEPDSASSQFFIMHKNSPHLDGAYAAFGKITEGMDVVNKIAETATDYSDRPLEKQVMKKVTVETFGEDYPEPETV
jgi:peptidyl-prolyl cis-trans isomerase B (cyclophilin B)